MHELKSNLKWFCEREFFFLTLVDNNLGKSISNFTFSGNSSRSPIKTSWFSRICYHFWKKCSFSTYLEYQIQVLKVAGPSLLLMLSVNWHLLENPNKVNSWSWKIKNCTHRIKIKFQSTLSLPCVIDGIFIQTRKIYTDYCTISTVFEARKYYICISLILNYKIRL